MLKRLIALIGALVLVFTLTIPCFADVTYDYEDELNVHDVDESFDGPVLFLRGDIDIDVRNSSGAAVGYSYSELYIYCYDGQLCAFSPKSMDDIFFCDGSMLYLYDNAGASVGSFSGSSYTITIGYFESDIIYASTSCSTWGFTCDSTEGGSSSGGFTQEDLDNAYDRGFEDGYEEGFTTGADSIDQDAIRDEGFDLGYEEGFTTGAESIDQDAIRQEGYDEGFTEGQESIDQDAIRQEGYDLGFTEGQESIDQDAIRQEGYEAALKDLEKGKSAYFEHCTFEATVCGITADTGAAFTHHISFTPSFTSFATVSFNTLYVEIKNYVNSFGASWDYVNSVEILMIWDDAYVYDFSILPLYAISDYGFDSGAVYTPRGGVYNLKLSDADSEGKRKFELIDYANGVTVKQINVKFDYLPEDALLNFRFFVPDQFYNNGYVDGYSDGFYKGADSDSSSSFNEGYEDGYTTGYLLGKNEGLGLVQQGDWKQLILAVVEAPINAFQSLFNFEVLGLDMRVAFGSILAVCVVLIIVKKVIF